MQKLEELIQPAEIPFGRDVASNIDELEPLTDEQREQIGELFDNMEVAHEHLACSCSALGDLSKSLKSKQLLLLSVRPLIQINAMPGWFEEPDRYRVPELRTYLLEIV